MAIWTSNMGPIALPPRTNADRIRSMTDEELAEWIYSVTTNALSILQIGSDAPTQSYFGWLTWLQQEVKE